MEKYNVNFNLTAEYETVVSTKFLDEHGAEETMRTLLDTEGFHALGFAKYTSSENYQITNIGDGKSTIKATVHASYTVEVEGDNKEICIAKAEKEIKNAHLGVLNECEVTHEFLSSYCTSRHFEDFINKVNKCYESARRNGLYPDSNAVQGINLGGNGYSAFAVITDEIREECNVYIFECDKNLPESADYTFIIKNFDNKSVDLNEFMKMHFGSEPIACRSGVNEKMLDNIVRGLTANNSRSLKVYDMNRRTCKAEQSLQID